MLCAILKKHNGATAGGGLIISSQFPEQLFEEQRSAQKPDVIRWQDQGKYLRCK
jgi:hypothetical protein